MAEKGDLDLDEGQKDFLDAVTTLSIQARYDDFKSDGKGSAGADSDIDIAFVFDKVADSFDLQVELMKIRRQFDARIEPHVFRTADFDGSHPLAGEILSTGVEIP